MVSGLSLAPHRDPEVMVRLDGIHEEVQSVKLTVREVEAGLSRMSDVVESLKSTVEGMARTVHGERAEPLVAFPLKNEGELEELLSKLKSADAIQHLVSNIAQQHN